MMIMIHITIVTMVPVTVIMAVHGACLVSS